jgi:hypothetical protein
MSPENDEGTQQFRSRQREDERGFVEGGRSRDESRCTLRDVSELVHTKERWLGLHLVHMVSAGVLGLGAAVAGLVSGDGYYFICGSILVILLVVLLRLMAKNYRRKQR